MAKQIHLYCKTLTCLRPNMTRLQSILIRLTMHLNFVQNNAILLNNGP